MIIYFAKDIGKIISTWAKSLVKPELGNIDARMGWYVIIGTIPIAVLGLLFSNQIETIARNLWLVASTLIVFGIILESRTGVGAKTRGVETLSIRSGLVYGFGQALALIPGVSRSGATISVGLFMGFTREAATRYAFLLAIPAVLTSGAVQRPPRLVTRPMSSGARRSSTVIAFAIGYAVIAWLIKYISTNSTTCRS